jgi:hypothetical protein
VPEWALFNTLAYAHGSNTATGAPIDSVDLFKVIGGIPLAALTATSGDSPIAGHVQIERCAGNYFIGYPSLGRRSCSFIDRDGAAPCYAHTDK